jgi:5-methylcytosine-specific restriction protein A
MSRKKSRPGDRSASRGQGGFTPGEEDLAAGGAPFAGAADSQWFDLDPAHTDPARIKREREKARQLRKTTWWQEKIRRGVCEYCEKKVPPEQLTLDHRVPLARGGRSMQGNVVAACRDCNRSKGLMTPVDALFQQLEQERKKGGDDGEGNSASE